MLFLDFVVEEIQYFCELHLKSKQSSKRVLDLRIKLTNIYIYLYIYLGRKE